MQPMQAEPPLTGWYRPASHEEHFDEEELAPWL
jgi:hypothetical protein